MCVLMHSHLYTVSAFFRFWDAASVPNSHEIADKGQKQQHPQAITSHDSFTLKCLNVLNQQTSSEHALLGTGLKPNHNNGTKI